ncbi:MAG: hypothetical protein AVDCRST_MAG41-1259, partial [uncultured Corynebacteriales bacterium]
GEGDLERHGHRGERRHGDRRGQSLLPALVGPRRLPARVRHALGVPVEGHRELPVPGGRRQGQRGRPLVLPGAEGRGQAHRRPRRLLEGRRGLRV